LGTSPRGRNALSDFEEAKIRLPVTSASLKRGGNLKKKCNEDKAYGEKERSSWPHASAMNPFQKENISAREGEIQANGETEEGELRRKL